ncbi:MAG TPA: kelch repeat-containing protein [Armatimonadota bacterium]
MSKSGAERTARCYAGVSRREALKRFGGGLAAAALIPCLSGEAEAALQVSGSRDAISRGGGVEPVLRATGQPRCQHTVTLLGDGRILAAGGWAGHPVSSAETFDPLAAVWRDVAPMHGPRAQHAAAALTSGGVLVVGGMSGGPLSGAEIYDPEADTWTRVAPLNLPRYQHAAAALPDGRILVTGGLREGPLSSAELYDPVADRWQLL